MNFDYGHWAVFKEVDIKDYLAFTYVITFKNGKKYIGVKKLWKKIKQCPSEFKRGPKCGFIESDWKTYSSSSNLVNEMLQEGIEPESFVIVGWYKTWGKALMAEMELQLANDVLRDPMWLNKQIGGHFNPNCFDDLTEDDIAKWLSYDVGNEHVGWSVMYKIGQRTKYVHPDEVERHLKTGWEFGRSKSEKHSALSIVSSYTLWDYSTNTAHEVTNQAEFARLHGIDASRLTNVVKGQIDLTNEKWGLPPEIARNRFPLYDTRTGKKYSSNAELESEYGLKRGDCYKLIKSGVVIKSKIESRKDYIERLSKLDIVKYVKKEHVRILMENSFKDLLNPLSKEERSELIIWVKQYLKYLES